MKTYAAFQFNPASLTLPRKPGISAYMRIKNEEKFLRAAILSHIDFYDEIIAVYNDCTDCTPEILRDLAAQYPEKIKVYHYIPKVHPASSKEHAQTPDDSVHGLANYYNYALAKTQYTVATKLDADHLAIPQNLAPWISQIRADIAAGREVAYNFSGINIIRNADGEIGINEKTLFGGNNDHFYHMVNADSYYINVEHFEELNPSMPKRRYMGIMYFHVKRLIPGREHAKNSNRVKFVSFDEFCTRRCHARIIRAHELKHRVRIRFRRFLPAESYLRYKYSTMRMIQLKDDLRGIDWKRDLLEHVANT